MTAFLPQTVRLIDDDGRLSAPWYRFFDELYRWSGLAGQQSPFWATVPVGAMSDDSSDPPAASVFAGNIEMKAFAAGVTNRVHFGLLVPQGYTAQSALRPFVRMARSTTGAGSVLWELEYTAAPIDGVFAAPSTVAMSHSTAASLEHTHVLGAEIAGAGLTPGSFVVCSLRRDGGSDTYADAAFLLSAGVYAQNSALGSQRIPGV